MVPRRRIFKKVLTSASLVMLLEFPGLAQNCQPENATPVRVPRDPETIGRLFRDCFFLDLHAALLSGADPKNGWSSSERERLKRSITGGQLGTLGYAQVPLPFGLDAWQVTLGNPQLTAFNAFDYFVNNPDASRMLVALHALDPITRLRVRRTFRREKRGKTEESGWNILYAKALDGFYRSPQALVLRDDGMFDLPGGIEAEPVWKSIFGVSPEDRGNRETFLTTLFQRDNGKAAYVVKVLQQLPRQVAGKLVLRNPGQSKEAVERFQRLYRSIESGSSLSLPKREPYDFAHVARFLGLSQKGELQLRGEDGSALVALQLSQTGQSETGGGPAERPMTADEALGQLLREGRCARRRFLFVSGILEGRPHLRDRGLMGQMLRGVDCTHPMYVALEDLPLDAGVARRYVTILDGMDHREAAPDAEVTAGLFEAGVVLLAQLSRSGGLEPPEIGRLFDDFLKLDIFSRLEVTPGKGEPGLFRWLSSLRDTLRNAERRVIDEKIREREEQVTAYRTLLRTREEGREAPLTDESGREFRDKSEDAGSGQQERPPRWVEIPRENESFDDLLIHALAGPGTTVEFTLGRERYRLDSTAEAAERMPRFQEQGLTRLSDLQELHAKRDALAAAVESGDIAAVAPAARDLQPRLFPEATANGKVGNEGSQRRYQRAHQSLQRIQTAPNSKDPATSREQLVYLDTVIAERDLDTLLGHLYVAEGADSQDLGLVRNGPLMSVSPTGRGAFALGSLFSLGDRLRLRHADSISDDSIPREVVSGLVAPVSMMSRRRLDDDALQAVRYSCQATEEFAADVASRGEAERLSLWADLARDLVSRSRLGLVSANPGDLREYLSPSDLYRIGRRLATGPDPGNFPSAVAAREALERLRARLGAKAWEALAEFGPRTSSYAGSFRLRDMDMPPYEWATEYGGLQGLQIFSDRLYDLKIAVARTVAEAGLPAAVLPIVLPTALEEMIRSVKMAFPYDWRPIVRAAQDFKAGDLSRILQNAIRDKRLTRVETTETLEKKVAQ